jgi:solute carrier family 13 (sodium-dependent dicarboxylate transporter), member 2/3/5
MGIRHSRQYVKADDEAATLDASALRRFTCNRFKCCKALFIAPVCALALLLVGLANGSSSAAASVCAIAVLMVLYWATEAVNVAVTALLPLMLMPLMGVQSGRVTAQYYFSDTIVVFFGSLLVGK